jgi:NADPH:quinone reductase-like Zn-dependent oxidoreductase
MKTAAQETYGPPSVLHLVDLDPPRVGDGDVLVRVHASAVTQGDRRLRSGDFPGISWVPGRLAMGLTGPRNRPGSMFAGRVAAVGKDVRQFAVGDDVFGSALERGGAYADQLVMAADSRIARMPAGSSYAEAAALPYGAITAWIYLRDLAAVQAGDRVCILGASGGVGLLAVQLARHLGAEVTAVCSAPTHALVRSLGATHTLDRQVDDFRRGTYDVVFDTVGASAFAQARASLSPSGRYLSLIVTARLLVEALVTSILGGRRAYASVAMGDARHLAEIAALVEAGALRPVLDRTFPLAEIAAAHAHLETGSGHGTVGIALG